MSDLDPKKPEAQSGQWIGIGIAIGAGFGVALGQVLDNPGLGIALGAAVGVALGAAMGARRRELPADPRARQIGILTAVVGLVVLLALVAIMLVRGS